MFDKRKDSDNPPARAPEASVSQKARSTAVGKSALIGAGIHVNGDITGTENLVVEGKVEGKIELPSSKVVIGQSGKVAANIVAKTVEIEGTHSGDVEGRERVVIAKSGNVRGNITAPRVMLEDGAVFKGSIEINPSESAVAELPLPSKQSQSEERDSDKRDTGYSGKK